MADKNNTAISLCVDKVLDHVGASEQIRRNHVEKGFIDEILMNLTFPIILHDVFRIHNFGSWCEGTTTKGLASDIDRILYRTDCPAVEQIPADGLGYLYLIINDGTTKPGYVKLQIVNNGIPLISHADIAVPVADTDQFRRVCLNNNSFAHSTNALKFLGIKIGLRGPAIASFGRLEEPEIDNNYALKCNSVPSFTKEWIRRHRKYGWPSKRLLDKMSQYGCFLVAKGHPSSQTEHLEWRISFSFQERELMFSLNSTQHKCYILMKMIKQDLKSQMVKQSFSSYHLKKVLFYTIENNPTHIWIPDNLVYCTELCLKQLLTWLVNENCPNYFVPEENMFDRLSSDVMKMAAKFIRDMLKSDGQYLKLLTCDKFRELLKESLSGKELSNLSRDAIEFDLYNKLILSKYSVYFACCITILADKTFPSETQTSLKLLLEQLRQSEERLASEKVFREIKQGVNLILPYIHLQIAQTIASMMLTVTDADRKRELQQEFEHHIEQAKASSSLSVTLVQASLLFNENMVNECATVLGECETSLKDNTVPLCPCSINEVCNISKLTEKVNTASISPLEFHRMYVTPYLMFLPSHAELVPTPLHYEMYRCEGANRDTVDPFHHCWHGVIEIDTNLYLFFLQYLVYSKLGQHDLAERAKWKMSRFLIKWLFENPYVGHIERAFNLMGWILRQENKLDFATECFLGSWQIKPDHNAATWHMLVMMYEQYIQRSKR